MSSEGQGKIGIKGFHSGVPTSEHHLNQPMEKQPKPSLSQKPDWVPLPRPPQAQQGIRTTTASAGKPRAWEQTPAGTRPRQLTESSWAGCCLPAPTEPACPIGPRTLLCSPSL